MLRNFEESLFLLNKIITMEGLNPEILKEICEARMPFGKYKDTILADLPINYLEWFHREGMPKGKLGMKLSTVYEIKLNGLVDLLTPIRGEVNYERPKKKVYKF